jgi:ribosomal protein L11 methyltransferase
MDQVELVQDLKKRWATVEFETTPDNEDMASWLMIQCGATGCEIIEIDPGGDIVVRATFDEVELSEELLLNIQTSLEEYGLSASLNSLRHKSVEEEDWLAKWKEGLEPFVVGNQFLISPPWFLDKLTPEEIGVRKVLVLEPGMAFGTGLHATTQYCLTAFEMQPHPQRIIDVGTGSGILAIASAMMSGPKALIIGVDIDPVAIEVAQKNLELNKVEKRVELICGSTDAVTRKDFDVIFSNLTCEDIISMLPEYERLLAHGGFVICAGILQEKLPMLDKELTKRRWVKRDEKITGMWAGITIARQVPSRNLLSFAPS